MFVYICVCLCIHHFACACALQWCHLSVFMMTIYGMLGLFVSSITWSTHFLHPMLRDEQEFDNTNMLKLHDVPSRTNWQNARRIDGSIKLNLFLRNDMLTVMIMHVKDLVIFNVFVYTLLPLLFVTTALTSCLLFQSIFLNSKLLLQWRLVFSKVAVHWLCSRVQL